MAQKSCRTVWSPIVYLPDLWAETTPDDEMAQQALRKEELNVTIRSAFHTWPTAPLHALDW